LEDEDEEGTRRRNRLVLWNEAYEREGEQEKEEDNWGFAPGTMATSILDYERLHLQAVSRRRGIPTVFISLRCTSEGNAEQVPRPEWYPYDGLEAPLGMY
jgi:hypothetical protein